jgi:L-histidine Nalpha-methyltransferase
VKIENMTTTTIVNELAKPAFTREFAQDVNLGLSAKSKYLKPSIFTTMQDLSFYDDAGSELFEQICHQPEYYLTRIEAAILEEHSSDIARMMQDNGSSAMIELGSGSSLKTRILLQPFLQIKRKSPLYYFPIDISHSVLQNTVERLSNEFPKLQIIGLSADYFDGIYKANHFISNENNSSARKIIVFLGSSIGNFESKEAESFLNVLADRLNKEDSLLIGFDLHKNERILNAAYNDSAGITAKFNLNILARINKELGGGFDLRLFKHHAFYNKNKRRIEMHLVSTRKQQVYIKETGKTFDFEEDESIHTENSFKYTLKQIDALAKKSNLKVSRHFTDRNHWFDVAMFERES